MTVFFHQRPRRAGSPRLLVLEMTGPMYGELDEAALEKRLEELRGEHRALDAEVKALQMCGVVDQLKVQRMKRRKLALKDEIALIEDQLNPDIIA